MESADNVTEQQSSNKYIHIQVMGDSASLRNNDRNPQSESDAYGMDEPENRAKGGQQTAKKMQELELGRNGQQSDVNFQYKDRQKKLRVGGVMHGCSSASDFSDEYSPSPNRGVKLLEKEESILHDHTSTALHLLPPEDLIAKSVFTFEPIKTGAPISFVKIDELKGFEKQIEIMNEPVQKPKAIDYSEHGGLTKAGTKSLADDLVRSYQESKVVYCRFGAKYIEKLEKQLASILNSGGTQVSTSVRTATYLINIKKLIKDHNIDSENVCKLKTKTTVQKSDCGPPTNYYTPESDQDQTLIFESRFESGNLLAAIKVSDTEYDLILQNDINTNGHTQWYFFRVGNTTAKTKIKFNLLNLAKPDSLYNYGMKVLAFSQQEKKISGLGWHRVGSEISYQQNNYKRENLRFTRYYYTFSFTHEFTHGQDQVYFAHCFPYTYSDLVDDLSRIEKESVTQNFFYRNTLCRTLAGNKCEYVTITSKDKDPKSERSLQKKGVFISARVHPGETNGSWMMKGLIDFLVSNAPEARVLREKFIFKIVPMLNPDGVINGNYRCSLCGSDLNRRYKAPSKILHPVVYAVKRLVKNFSKEREIALFCDLHGHSRRKNIFMYGNNYTEKPEATRMFPYIMSKLCDYFSFEYSRFSLHKSKEATARIAMWKELKIPNIFTMEASFSGADKGVLKDQHFTTEHLMVAGRKLLEALIVYCKIDVQQSILEIRTRQSKHQAKEEEQEPLALTSVYTQLSIDSLQKELNENKELIKMTEGKGDDGEGESSASDSDPSEDNFEEEELQKIVPIKIKKKKPEKKKLQIMPRKKIEEPIVSLNKKDLKQLQQKAVANKSPVKRILNYTNPLYDRLKLRQLKKIEMVDAWTQTSDRGSDNEEAHKQQHQRRIANSASKLHQQQHNSFNASDIKMNNIVKHSEQLSSEHSNPNLNHTQKIKLDSGHSPQPQIRIRKEPFKPQNMPSALGTKQDLMKDTEHHFPKTDTEESSQSNHQRHFSIENPKHISGQMTQGVSSRSKRLTNASDNESKLTTIQQREKNLTSPKNSWKAKSSNLRQNSQKQEPQFRKSYVQKEQIDATMSQHRQSIYSSLDKSQAQIPSSKLKYQLPELSDMYLMNQKQKLDQSALNHQLSGHLTRSGISQQKYNLNQSAQNLVRNQNLFKLQQQIIKGYNDTGVKPGMGGSGGGGKSQDRVQTKPLYFTHSEYQQKLNYNN